MTAGPASVTVLSPAAAFAFSIAAATPSGTAVNGASGTGQPRGRAGSTDDVADGN
jgi:hypothetical protein